MKTPLCLFLATLGAATACAAAPAADVAPPQSRAATVAFAKTLLAGQAPAVASAADGGPLKNPFNPVEPPPPAPAAGVATVPQPDAGARLETIAPLITPSGSIEIGGVSLLLFGQKRFKVGDRLPIVFEGKSYEVEITDVKSTSFTLRLNGEEITRPIKFVSKP